MGWKKGASGGRQSCPGCSGSGSIKTQVQRVIPKDQTADQKKDQIVTETVWVDCKRCGGTGDSN
ncbi:hypothetical protein Tbis_2189 [Thermobispora bispora DSM 43833]|uniref:Uncharacterized protein n=1 Tax=Thermobispora bispora (strain ATCC 19993 / DSM 43833 / CBS 139.67 / JCM 10125 / KCTC 9307 / NBRC 14880 / R51) TaxID=469371 RepID=D6Y325_THEBD|nr:hypothetical protein Tbis_2189 [Thermobispora bispora DSM 43833]